MRIAACVLVATLTTPASVGGQSLALPMAEVSACAIEYAGPLAFHPRWGGRIADYDLSTDGAGAVVSLTRRRDKDREHLWPWARLDQFEDCVRRWTFEPNGRYVVSLAGGTIFGDVFRIQVSQSNRTFRLHVPVAKPAG